MSVRDADDHVTELLGCYALGLTSASEDHTIERHLLTCATCCDEHEYLAPAAWNLAKYADARVAQPQLRQLGPVLDLTTTRLAGKPVRSGVAEARSRPKIIVSHRKPGPTARKFALAAAVLVVAAGLGLGAWLRGLESTPQSTFTDLVATAVNDSTGVGAVVVVTPHPVRVEMKITVRGLEVDAAYRLLLITRSGRSVVVTEWRAEHPTQVIRGTAPVPLEDVGLLAIGTADGSVLLAVPFGPGTLVQTPRSEP